MGAAANTNAGRVKYGSKYRDGRDLKDIAKDIRADLKAGVASGELPAAKYSVTISRYSMGQSLSVRIDAVPFTIVNEERVKLDVLDPHARYTGSSVECLFTDAAMALQRKVEALVAEYNFDGSDPQADYSHVNFYAHVDFGAQERTEHEAMRATYEAEGEALAKARRATMAARSSCPAAWTHATGRGCDLCE